MSLWLFNPAILQCEIVPHASSPNNVAENLVICEEHFVFGEQIDSILSVKLRNENLLTKRKSLNLRKLIKQIKMHVQSVFEISSTGWLSLEICIYFGFLFN